MALLYGCAVGRLADALGWLVGWLVGWAVTAWFAPTAEVAAGYGLADPDQVCSPPSDARTPHRPTLRSDGSFPNLSPIKD
jgi:hypothetical protein